MEMGVMNSDLSAKQAALGLLDVRRYDLIGHLAV